MVLIYHLVFPAKYRRVVFENEVERVLKDICLKIEKRYQVKFLEIGTMIKSLTAQEVFKRCPQVKKKLWGGEFWTDGYFASTVGKHGNEDMIGNYVKKQGEEYQKLHEDRQLALF
jgi:putative transposase